LQIIADSFAARDGTVPAELDTMIAALRERAR
jgi:hypothetical protein